MLLESQINQFEKDGYLVVKQVISPDEIKRLREAHQNLLVLWAKELNTSVENYERVVSQWTNVHQHHEAFEAQIRHATIARMAQQLLGESESVQLFHDHIISKPAHHSSTIPWHQDYPFWPIDKPQALSCWIALDDANETTGSMHFMPEAHHEGEKPPVDFLNAPWIWGERETQKVSTSLKAGDCVFHHCLAWHTSGPNQSTNPRRAFIMIMMDGSCRWDPAHSDWHPMNEHVCVEPGEHFNTDKFPILTSTYGNSQ
jgi:ectoine hydroxylase-related dioxygenase (phytanoyl-CoA dioxygenase family)